MTDEPSIPDGYKEVTEYYKDNVLTKGYAPFAVGEKARWKENGSVVEIESLFGPGPVFQKAIIKTQLGNATVPFSDLEGLARKVGADGTAKDQL